jgi:hypothetical protein
MASETRIQELLTHRTDLSTFIVHLTREAFGHSARYNLKRILKYRRLEARKPFGQALKYDLSKTDRASQKCVSFSETPLDHIKWMVGEIPKRQISLSPYGLAFTKMTAREKGANPVWYIDITQGSNREWLSKSVDKLVGAAVRKGSFADSAIARLCPFIEQMGSGARSEDGYGYQKEFWWEREWRHEGNFTFLREDIAFGLAPEESIEEFEGLLAKEKRPRKIRFLDPRWSLDRMIAHLCKCEGPLTPFDRNKDVETG